MTDEQRIWVTEVHNFGGFFGGDTVTLTAVPWPEGDEETLTIDEKALTNVAARHTIAPEMVLSLQRTGERIDHARLLAARELDVLRQALGLQPSAAALATAQIRSYHCSHCDLWITGLPISTEQQLSCAICGAVVPNP